MYWVDCCILYVNLFRMDNAVTVHIYDDTALSRSEIASTLSGSVFLKFHPVINSINRDHSNEFSYCCMINVETLTNKLDAVLSNHVSAHIDSPILYSRIPDLSDVVYAIKRGAFDYLKLPLAPEVVKSCIFKATKHNTLMYEALREKSSISSRLTRLTQRENSILELILQGHSNKNISHFLNISQRTVENHRAHIMNKMSAKTITHLIHMLNIVSK